VRQDFAEMGRRCITTLLGDGDVPAPLVPELILRGTTAPPAPRRR
jgi:DNA-binding LacI/PurR family transcriptional regulator